MLTENIEIEERGCRNCGRKFRVMTTSAQSVCSTACEVYFMREHGEQRKVLSSAGSAKRTIAVNVGTPTKPIDKKSSYLARAHAWPTMRSILKETEKTINEIRKSETEGGPNMQKETVNLPTPPTERGIHQIKSVPLKKNTPEETGETQQELSEGQQNSLETVGLTSSQLLRQSAEKLLACMEAIVSKADLDKSTEGVLRVEPHRVETVIKCANALTSITQTQVNIIKAIKDICKK